MRLAVAFLAPVAFALAGCTTLDTMNRLGTTDQAEPFPTGYKALLRHHYGLNRPLDLEVTSPRTLLAANAFDKARWYVCVRDAAGTETIHVITGGKLEGTIPGSGGDLCGGGTYEPLG